MRITERQLRQIIKETLLEEQHRIDESAISAIKKGLIALMLTHGVSAVTNVAKNLSSNDVQEYQMHKSYSGSENNSTVKKDKIDEAWAEYDKARKMSTSGHPNSIHRLRKKRSQAIRIAARKLESLGIKSGELEDAYTTWKENTSNSDGMRSINW